MEVVIGLNHEFIRKWVVAADAIRPTYGNNIVNTICNTAALFPFLKSRSIRNPNALVLVVQLCLLHLSLDPTICKSRAHCFNDSQQQVYKCYEDEPIFRGKNGDEINFPWLLHVANFFKFHLKQPDGEGVLAHVYGQLEKCERPRAWPGKVNGGTLELARSWKGAFSKLCIK